MGIFNCDWLSFTADFANYRAQELETLENDFDPDQSRILAKLFALLDEEREKPNGGFVDLGLWKFEVYPNGNRQYYYILHNDDMELRLARFRSKDEAKYPVYVHFKSFFLWSSLYGCNSLKEKYLLVIEWLEQILGCKYITSKINRLDLCYHTDDAPELDENCFVGRHVNDNRHRSHRRVTSVNCGDPKSEYVYLRCYNKFVELKSSQKNWITEIWVNQGLNVRNVWNIEFQLRREFFRETKFGVETKDTAEEVIDAMKTIWLYLTTKWITYRVPDATRRSRWSLHPWWQTLYEWVETSEKLTRDRQRSLPMKETIIPVLRGYLTSLAARTDMNLDDGTLFKLLLEEIRNYDEEKERNFNEEIEIKKMLIDPENTGNLEAAPATELITDMEQSEVPEVEPEVAELIEQLLLFEHMPLQYNRALAKLSNKKEPLTAAPDKELQK